MSNPSKRKGDAAELEVQGILRDLLGLPVRRKLGAGRKDDTGDMDGIPDTVVAVRNRKTVTESVRNLPLAAEVQRERAGASFAASFVRLYGGEWRVVLTPEQWATYVREAISDQQRAA